MLRTMLTATLAAALLPLGAAEPALTYFGRATVKLASSQNYIIYIDPFAPGDHREPADLVLITHGHDDHNKLASIPLKPGAVIVGPAGAVSVQGARAVKETEVFTAGPATVMVVPAYNDNHGREGSVGYVVSLEGVKVYHAGDTSYIPEMANLASLQIDYALFPTDGFWNMGGEEARRCADAVKARHALAMHSSPKGLHSADLAAKLKGPDVLALGPGETLVLRKSANP